MDDEGNYEEIDYLKDRVFQLEAFNRKLFNELVRLKIFDEDEIDYLTQSWDNY